MQYDRRLNTKCQCQRLKRTYYGFIWILVNSWHFTTLSKQLIRKFLLICEKGWHDTIMNYSIYMKLSLHRTDEMWFYIINENIPTVFWWICQLHFLYIDLEVSFLSILKIKSIDSYFDKWCVYQYLSVCYMKLSVFGLIKLERTRKVIFFYGRPR